MGLWALSQVTPPDSKRWSQCSRVGAATQSSQRLDSSWRKCVASSTIQQNMWSQEICKGNSSLLTVIQTHKPVTSLYCLFRQIKFNVVRFVSHVLWYCCSASTVCFPQEPKTEQEGVYIFLTTALRNCQHQVSAHLSIEMITGYHIRSPSSHINLLLPPTDMHVFSQSWV